MERLTQRARFKFVLLNSPSGIAQRAATVNSPVPARQGCDRSVEYVPYKASAAEIERTRKEGHTVGWR